MVATARSHFCPRCGTRRSGAGGCDRDGTQLAEITDNSLLGTQIGNYVVVKRLGEGGMGAVYRAIQPSIGAQVAIKVLHATPESQAGAVKRFLLEAQAVNRVKHPNLISIIDTGELPDRRPYLVMEMLDGIALSDGVGLLPYPLACHVAAEALDALAAVHDHDIVHRDLKPANIFLTRGGRVVVLDFGIAKLVSPDAAPAVTASGIIGTPEYMSPEQIRSQPIDRRTDIYAMGVLLYEAITGKRPFSSASTFEMLVQHVERTPPSPREWSPELPVPIADIVMQALAKDPAHRFATAAAMAAALRTQVPPARAELAQFVEKHAPPPPPVPLVGEPEADETVRDRISNQRIEAPRPASSERATVAERPRSSQRAVTPYPIDQSAPVRKSSRTLLFSALAVVVAGMGVVIALVINRDDPPPETPRPPPVVAAVPAPAPVAAPAADPPVPALSVVEVVPTPANATIEIDGALMASPARAHLHPGPHRVVVKLAGYQTVDETHELGAGERVVLRMSLVRKSATAKPATKPAPTRKSTQLIDTSLESPADRPPPLAEPLPPPVKPKVAPPDRKSNPFDDDGPL